MNLKRRSTSKKAPRKKLATVFASFVVIAFLILGTLAPKAQANGYYNFQSFWRAATAFVSFPFDWIGNTSTISGWNNGNKVYGNVSSGENGFYIPTGIAVDVA